MTTYGQKGGEGPTRGKKAIVYTGVTPDGQPWRKRVFKDYGDGPLIATGFMHEGKACVTVWSGEPAWEGDFGRMVAQKMEDAE